MQRIQLGNTVFEGKNDVYVFDGDTTALVDTGVSMPTVREELETGLSTHGISVEDIDEIFLTHWHPDHAGLAGEIQDISGASVRIHEADAPLVDGSEDSLLADESAQTAQFDEWGMPSEAREALQSFLDGVMHDLRGTAIEVTKISDGDRFLIDGLPVTTVHLPGHTAGSVAYEFDATMTTPPSGFESNADPDTSPGSNLEAFVGDVILPEYTPNVGGADTRVEDPLGTYVESLSRIIARGWDRVWPGHRTPIEDPAGRAATILDHHRRRTRRVVSVLQEHGPADTWTVSAKLFGDLQNIHILHGPGEASAHLEHLRQAGILERDGHQYVLVEGSPDIDALFPPAMPGKTHDK